MSTPRRRAARIYTRPRFGLKLTPRLGLQLALALASLGLTAWWAVHRLHH